MHIFFSEKYTSKMSATHFHSTYPVETGTSLSPMMVDEEARRFPIPKSMLTAEEVKT